MRIYLADLGHNQLTVSSDVYPLGVANLAAYARVWCDSREPLDFSIFREPQDLKAALDAAPPEVLGLSGYAWNEELSLCFARYAKTLRPETLTLLGGPNFPLTAPEQERFLRALPEIDIAVRGPTYEGERAFVNLLRRFILNGRRLEGVQEEPLAGSGWIRKKTGDFVMGPEVERIRDLDEIPSPYLAGWMDPFFQTGYFPMLQIARGCPFSCTFCNSSVESNSKIYAHSVENVKADLLYIAQRVRPEVTLCFADDNFGMYPRDEEIADYMAWLQDRFNWPRYIRTTTGKNQHERIIRVMRKMRGVLPMTAAVQSMDRQVLVNIKRNNIKLQAYAEIQNELRSQGMQAYGELILCLPGESRATFMNGVRELMESGVKRVSAHQLMLLHGAPLANPEERARFGMKTRFRVVARDVGDYTGEPVVETEEMVVETPTFSFDDYLETRVFHLLLTVFYYEGNFEEAFEFAREFGVSAFDLTVRMQSMLPQAPEQFRKLIAEFVQESREELFPTRQACLAWARRHFDGLVAGQRGGNLLSKYSMMGRFYSEYRALDFLEAAIASIVAERAAGFDPSALRAVMDYLRFTVIQTPFRDSLAAAHSWFSAFDMEAWRRDGYQRELWHYRYREPVQLEARVTPERKALIETRIATFGEHPSGLGKFTRSMFAHDLRRKVSAAGAAA